MAERFKESPVRLKSPHQRVQRKFTDGGGGGGVGGVTVVVCEAAHDAHWQHSGVVVRDQNILRRSPFTLHLICSVAITRAAYCPG